MDFSVGWRMPDLKYCILCPVCRAVVNIAPVGEANQLKMNNHFIHLAFVYTWDFFIFKQNIAELFFGALQIAF